jgi:predicted DNA-binding transcriptional regulator AlpA
MGDGVVLLNEQKVAEMIGMSVAWLRLKRQKGDGIPAVKVGRSVRYRRADVVAWVGQLAR